MEHAGVFYIDFSGRRWDRGFDLGDSTRGVHTDLGGFTYDVTFQEVFEDGVKIATIRHYDEDSKYAFEVEPEIKVRHTCFSRKGSRDYVLELIAKATDETFKDGGSWAACKR